VEARTRHSDEAGHVASRKRRSASLQGWRITARWVKQFRAGACEFRASRDECRGANGGRPYASHDANGECLDASGDADWMDYCSAQQRWRWSYRQERGLRQKGAGRGISFGYFVMIQKGLPKFRGVIETWMQLGGERRRYLALFCRKCGQLHVSCP
jgi:hypothetical protein